MTPEVLENVRIEVDVKIPALGYRSTWTVYHPHLARRSVWDDRATRLHARLNQALQDFENEITAGAVADNADKSGG